MSAPWTCRLCGHDRSRVFLDLGVSPLANAYLRPADLDRPEPVYPLCAQVCERCLLVQLPELATAEAIFGGEYLYFSSYSESWLAHCRRHAEAMCERRRPDSRSLVVEIASNDGHLLRCFQERGAPVLGIEPAANVARVAEERGVPTLVRFFGARLAEELRAAGRAADLLIGNNVLAHVPDLADFALGMKILLAPGGLVSLEVPHLARLLEQRLLDTIYHEHFSYFTLHTAARACASQGLVVFDVEELPTHGGSLRLFAAHAEERPAPTARLTALLQRERAEGLCSIERYLGFGDQVEPVRRDLRAFLLDARARGASVAGYGAPAKGNTLLNWCGVDRGLIAYTVDRSPHKQGLALPGSRIPVVHPDHLRETRPDYLLVLPWNLREEIIAQTEFIRGWGGRHVVAIPALEVLP